MWSLSQELRDGIVTIIDKTLRQKNYAVITDALVLAQNDDGTYKIQYAGKQYNLPLYGNNTPTINMTAKLFIPGNQLSRAFIM